MRIIIAVLLLLVVFSACASKNDSQTSNGLVINSFTIDPMFAEADDRVRFFLDFENAGRTTAQCIVGELYGLESWYSDEGTILTGSRPWSTQGFSVSYINDQLRMCYYDYKTRSNVCLNYDRKRDQKLGLFMTSSWNSFLIDFCSSYAGLGSFPEAQFLNAMTPPLPQTGRPGQSASFDWTFRPPVLPEGVTVEYPVTARLSYAYTTTAVINMRAFNKEEYRRMKDAGQQLEYPIDVQNSEGSPIQVMLKKGASPIIVNEQSPIPTQLENYQLEFVNVGDGYPLATGDQDTGFVFATAEVSGPGVYFYDCLGQRGGTELFDYDVVGSLVKIRGVSNTAPFGCTIAIDRAQWINNPMGTISLTFNIFYRYSVDAEDTVTVYGLELA